MRDDVTLSRRLSLAGRIQKMIPGPVWLHVLCHCSGVTDLTPSSLSMNWDLMESFFKFVEMEKSWKNNCILDQPLIEKSTNFEIDIEWTRYIAKNVFCIH